MSCRNEQDALESGYVFTVNPAPPPPPTSDIIEMTKQKYQHVEHLLLNKKWSTF